MLACMVATISIIDHDLKPSHFRAFTDLLETYSFRATYARQRSPMFFQLQYRIKLVHYMLPINPALKSLNFILEYFNAGE